MKELPAVEPVNLVTESWPLGRLVVQETACAFNMLRRWEALIKASNQEHAPKWR